MLMAQYRDGKGTWTNIPMLVTSASADPTAMAYAYAMQHELLTRVVDTDGKNLKVIKEFKVTKVQKR